MKKDEVGRLRCFGWVSLFIWALGGACLEWAHAFKLAAYLDDEVVRLMLRLAHAHGVGLSLVVLAFATSFDGLFDLNENHGANVGRTLRLGACMLPAGFLLGALCHSESDPGLGIGLAPVGALCVIMALAQTAWASVQIHRRAKAGRRHSARDSHEPYG